MYVIPCDIDIYTITDDVIPYPQPVAAEALPQMAHEPPVQVLGRRGFYRQAVPARSRAADRAPAAPDSALGVLQEGADGKAQVLARALPAMQMLWAVTGDPKVRYRRSCTL